MKLHDIYKEVAKERGVSIDSVRKVYSSYWRSIRNIISDIPSDYDKSYPHKYKIVINSLGYLKFNWYKNKKYNNKDND